jgi:hypothetical protein
MRGEGLLVRRAPTDGTMWLRGHRSPEVDTETRADQFSTNERYAGLEMKK